MRPDDQVNVYIHKDFVDFRMAINGLSIIVQESMAMDPYSTALFVFTNRRRNRVKILYWERNGFCLWQKRLERDRFAWPAGDDEVISIDGESLNWLLDGFDIWRNPPHQHIKYAAVT